MKNVEFNIEQSYSFLNVILKSLALKFMFGLKKVSMSSVFVLTSIQFLKIGNQLENKKLKRFSSFR